MSSGPNPAILLFPTGTDIYSNKVDQGVPLTESHTTPILPNSGIYYTFSLNHVPLYNGGILGSTVSIAGYTEVTGLIGAANYRVTYSGNFAGTLAFAAGNTTVTGIQYIAAGDNIVSEWFNSLQTSVGSIEGYLLSGNQTAVQVTGGSMSGPLTMNGAGIRTSVSGNNTIGSNASPFADVISNVITTNEVQSFDATNSIFLGNAIGIGVSQYGLSASGNGLVMSGNAIAMVESDGVVMLSGNIGTLIVGVESGVYIAAGNDLISMDGNVVPTGSFVYNLGSPSQRWKTIYADSIDAISSKYLPITGGNLTGPLTMSTGQSINTDYIHNSLTSLTVTSTNDINLNAAGNINATAPFVNLNNNLGVGPAVISVGSSITPNQSGTYNIGSSDNPFNVVYANSILGAAISGAFVPTSGGQMYGDLNLGVGVNLNTSSIQSSGTLNINSLQQNIFAQNNFSINMGSGATQVWDFGVTQSTMGQTLLPATSGIYDIGSAAQPLRAIYADNIRVGSVGSGISVQNAQIGTVLITGSVIYGPGVSVVNQASGTVNMGSLADPFGTIYANNIVTNGSTGSLYLLKYGDTMIGNMVLGTGSNIVPSGSGINNIGSASNPLGSLYANNIFGANLSGQYVAIAGDQMTGPLTVTTVKSTGNLNLLAPVGFVNITGNQITETAQEITLTSTVGPIIIGANNELQLNVNGSTALAINSSGIQAFNNIFPNVSGTYSLGTPQNPFNNIYAQNIIPIGGSGTGTFVLLIGSTMVGNLGFVSGVGIAFTTSGNSNIGSPTNPAGTLYVDHLVTTNPSGGFVHVTGDDMTGPLTINGALNYLQTDNIVAYTMGGQLWLGSGASTIRLDPNLADNQSIIITSGASITISDSANPLVLQTSGLKTSGNIYPHTSGNASIGTLATPYANLYATGVTSQLVTTANIYNNQSSGNGTIGTVATPYASIYVKTINNQPVPIPSWNEIPAGTVNSLNTVFTTTYPALSGTQRLYRAGLRQTPNGIDYTYSGNTITFNNAPISGDNILIDYSHT